MQVSSAQYYYEELGRLLQLAPDAQPLAYRLLGELLNEATHESGLLFSGCFARLHYVCQEFEVSPAAYARLNDLRARWHRNELGSKQQWHSDLRALAHLVQRVKGEPLPLHLEAQLPRAYVEPSVSKKADSRCRRVLVARLIDESCCEVVPQDSSVDVRWVLHLKSDSADWLALGPWLTVGMQLNLIEVVFQGDRVIAQHIIVEPDHLVDVSSIAACFQPFGVSAALHVLHRITPATPTRHTLLGLFASQLLDEAVHEEVSDYATSISRFFQHHAVSFATCADFQDAGVRREFHSNASLQQQHLQQMAREQFPHALHLSASDILLEPSFFCERLGLQGRMDLLTRNLHTIIEQKSGKRDFTGQPPEAHRVQMLLYMAILHYGMGVPYAELRPYLLYSRYAPPEGLMRIPNAPQLLHEALLLRNEIVVRERKLATHGARDFLENLMPEDLHTLNCGALWTRYKLPELESLLAPFKGPDRLAQTYFYRFHRFLTLEQQCSRLGTSEREASGFAAAWQASLDERRQAGNILSPLVLDRQALQVQQGAVIAELSFFLSASSATDDIAAPPNFRVGDIVVCYPYTLGHTPDLRRGFVHRASILAITSERLVLRLRAPQSNVQVFQLQTDDAWAVEPDYMESSSAALFRGLYAFLTSLPHRRALLLGQRRAVIDTTFQRALTHQNAEIDLLVERATQARDFFLLVGPPGTGKTSVGLMSLVREELATPSHRLLLGAFTNRAVDEICSKLVKEGLPFVRIGTALGCAPEFRPYLLGEQLAAHSGLDAIKGFLTAVRIVVGTTASLAGASPLLSLARFSLAIIDEASQLLEPHLLPLLMAEAEGQAAIARFVFIGDHKQLPAVVQQSERQSAVNEEELRAIGLTDCRRSLFERLMGLLPAACIYHFTRHGRMHPQVAEFANVRFYAGRLQPIPLPHQKQLSGEPRVCFYDCMPDADAALSPKTNAAEAQLIVRLACQEWKRVRATGRAFEVESDLGIIVPYRHQIALVRRALQTSEHPELAGVAIDTVERFQGSEREVIIYAFTVSRVAQLRFLCNSQFMDETGALIDRKLNVALTRSRQRTLIVGNAALLRQVPLYAALIESCAQGYVEDLSQ